jgi:hypothetical protein
MMGYDETILQPIMWNDGTILQLMMHEDEPMISNDGTIYTN